MSELQFAIISTTSAQSRDVKGPANTGQCHLVVRKHAADTDNANPCCATRSRNFLIPAVKCLLGYRKIWSPAHQLSSS